MHGRNTWQRLKNLKRAFTSYSIRWWVCQKEHLRRFVFVWLILVLALETSIICLTTLHVWACIARPPTTLEKTSLLYIFFLEAWKFYYSIFILQWPLWRLGQLISSLLPLIPSISPTSLPAWANSEKLRHSQKSFKN